MQDWQELLDFLRKEVVTGESKRYPATLINMIKLLLTGAEIIYPMVQHLQDPENCIHKICPECGLEFTATNQWIKTCSIKCHKEYIANPQSYLYDKGTEGSTIMLMQQVEYQEKA